jgi:hypothetical protein
LQTVQAKRKVHLSLHGGTITNKDILSSQLGDLFFSLHKRTKLKNQNDMIEGRKER